VDKKKLKMNNEDPIAIGLKIDRLRSKLIWLASCFLFLSFFSTRLHSASASQQKTKSEVASPAFVKTVAGNVQFKIFPIVKTNPGDVNYCSSFIKKQFTVVRLPSACSLKKKKLLRFRHHLKPSENEELPS
jgi:hypothetical protein